MPIVEFVTLEGRRLLINTRGLATSILVDNELALNFDQEGRLTGAWIEGRNYRRSLDNRIIEKREGPRPGLSYRVRRELDRAEGAAFLGRVRDLVAGYRQAVCDPQTRSPNGSTPADRAAACRALDHVLECGPERLERERQAFHQIYKPINILPPDQYLALVLQATEGCSYNRCSFCSFYRDRRFIIKTLPEFRKHVRDVRVLFASAIQLRKSIFLADANALVIPQEQLLPILEIVSSEFAIEPRGLDRAALRVWRAEHPVHFDGVYSFIDAFTTRRISPQDFADLAARGLRRVYLGLESGDAELLKFLGKPNSPKDALELAQTVKAGGVGLGIIVLAGAGGAKFAAGHVRHTAELVNAMPLDENDLIYFSELVDLPGSKHSEQASEAGIQPLTVEEIERQMAEIRAAFRFKRGEHAPRISYYDVREFVY